MINKRILIIISIIVILTTLLFLFFKNDSVINQTNKKKITQTETSSLIRKIDANIIKPINIGSKTNIKAKNKNKKKELDTDLKEFMNNFFAEMKNKSFEKRFEVLGELVEKNINIIGYHNEFYNLITNENNRDLRRELMNLFFEMYDSNTDKITSKPTQEQHEEIKKLIIKMVQNEEIKNKVLTEMRFLLNAEEIESIYNQYGSSFDDDSKSRLLNSYTNSSILEGKDPYSGNLSTEVEKHISKEKLKKRTQNLLGFMSKFTEGKDTSSWDNEFIRKQLESPIANAKPDRYIEWMRAKASMLQGYQAKAQFINSEFHKISQPYKHEFILRMPTYTPMVENLYAYLLERERELLQISVEKVNIADRQVITNKKTVSLVKELDSNYQEINIGTHTIGSANIKKTAKTKSIFYEKEFMDNFFAKMKNKSFEKRFKAFIELDKQDINLIGYHQEMYDLIISEDNTQLRKQLLIAFFGMYSPNRNEKTFESTKEQHEEIKNLVLKMMLNQEIKDEVVGREFRLLSADEIENIYSQYQNEFNDEHKPAIIESEQIAKNVEIKDTIKFSGNVVKLGFQKENISNNKKNTAIKKQPTKNKVANDFLKNYANEKLTFQEKIKALETMLIHEPSFWGKHNELYNLIVNEKDKRLVGELVPEFFSLYARPYNGELPNPTPEERAEISNLVKKLIENPLTRDRSLARANILLNNDEIQNTYQELKHQLIEEEQQGLLDSYIDGMILDGKNPTSEGFNEVEKYLPKEEIKKRTQNLLGFMSKFTEGKDTSSWDNEFIRKQLESPIANAQPDRYIEWMRAKASMLQGYQAKAQFINSEFHKISQPYKHEFILRMPTYTPMVENLYAYLLERERELLQILTSVIRIDDPKVFKALTEFRAIFLFSNNNNLRQGIDRIIKQLIDILPDYQVSLDILKFIKDEQVYIPNNNFNIDSHIQRISSNITTKKKESDLDTGKIPDDNPL